MFDDVDTISEGGPIEKFRAFCRCVIEEVCKFIDFGHQVQELLVAHEHGVAHEDLIYYSEEWFRGGWGAEIGERL